LDAHRLPDFDDVIDVTALVTAHNAAAWPLRPRFGSAAIQLHDLFVCHRLSQWRFLLGVR